MKFYSQYIESNHSVLLGKPVIKGTRISVELILRKLAQGASVDDLVTSYPHLNADKIQAVIAYAADVMANEELLSPEE